MEEQSSFEVNRELLEKLGLSDEMIDKALNSSAPTITNNAAGGKGGHGISLTYVDNYSTLLLVYTFLLNTIKNNRQENSVLNAALLSTLETAMEEQQMYRKEFLEAIRILNEKR